MKMTPVPSVETSAMQRRPAVPSTSLHFKLMVPCIVIQCPQDSHKPVPIRPRWREVAAPVLRPVPEAAITVFSTPDDVCCDTRNMQSSFAVNKYLHTVASGWIVINIPSLHLIITKFLKGTWDYLGIESVSRVQEL